LLSRAVAIDLLHTLGTSHPNPYRIVKALATAKDSIFRHNHDRTTDWICNDANKQCLSPLPLSKEVWIVMTAVHLLFHSASKCTRWHSPINVSSLLISKVAVLLDLPHNVQ
jgi:hypothetical protein